MANFMKRGSKWQARVSWRDDLGKLRQKSKLGFDTKQQAKQWAVEQEKKHIDGQLTDEDPIFANYFDEWFSTYKKDKISLSTQRLYTKTSERIHKHWGNKKISDVTRRQYQKFMNDFGKDHAKETVQKTNSIIRACVKDAILDGLIAKDFTQRIELIWDKNRTVKVQYLSIEQINKLVKSLEDDIKPPYISRYMILTAIYTGMRLGEIMALKWDDINFNFKTIRINKSYDYVSGGKIKPPKTESSNRTIKVNQSLLDLLAQLKQNHQDFVFMGENDKIPGSSAVNKTLRKHLSKCGIERHNFHFHSLRHSHVAYLLANDIDLYAISQRLGHSNMTTTAKKYAYLIDEYRARSDERIDNALEKIGEDKPENSSGDVQMLYK
ncbi:tyrosine-type recombinase/integrase [Limosilactobacillus oris]|uniref:tyrosine-type recombinase/integrase n=1 Tax=Limosilactobacillus oris TaxID=1632 RepID=UPI001883471B|nr:tyrosine-type recombinase/integrase [Limosilactobacillus oris]MBF0600818.1 site-specific integrase [Limosilactobacillus oris]